jgi:hypothetical protein
MGNLEREFSAEVARRRNLDQQHVDSLVAKAHDAAKADQISDSGNRYYRAIARAALMAVIVAVDPTATGTLIIAMIIDFSEAIINMVRKTR